MKVAAVVAGGVPNPGQNGSMLTVWTVVNHLLAHGHEVAVALLLDEHADDDGTNAARIEQLRATGASVHVAPSRAGRVFERMAADSRSRLRRAWSPPAEELLPSLLDADAVAELCDELRPDAVYAYHWEGVAATRALRGRVPRLATVVDLPQLSSYYRWRAEPGKLTRRGLARLLWLQARLRRLPPLLVELLNECEASVNHAAHHAAWLREHGARGCEYLPTPIEDRAGESWRAARESARGPRPRLFLIGHLRGVSTLEGLDLFAQQVVPRLEARLGPEALEIRIAGAYEPPPRLAAALSRPSVRLLGHVEDVDAEFAAADCLVVPTSIPLGTRVRILSAFSFGCPVVAHRSNALGIPELEDGANVLLGETGDELADAIVRLVSDPELRRRLEDGARQTYERYFAPGVAAAEIASRLERIAAAPVTAQVRSIATSQP